MTPTARLLTFLGVIVACVTLTLPASLHAQETIDPEGRYELIQPPQPTESPGKVEIVDVFWYGCPHCWRFLPSMEALEKRKADYVEIRRMPAIFRRNWEIHARAFYTAKLLNSVDTIHRPLFSAIHEKGQKLDTRESLREFFVARGIDGEAFDKTFDSFAVETLLRKSTVMQGRYGVRGTASLAGGYDEMTQVAEALAAREHKATMAAR